jgi:hypothetical protein
MPNDTSTDKADTQSSLKQIAFVAMPFGTKRTGLPPGKKPSEVDFDAIWERAIFPALDQLNYLPIRADNQPGSVIIKDMLQQLVFADLVIADISIPNGNVYYEAGVRHAAKEKGCVLISAEWSRPLFDLAQITHLKYPYPDDILNESDLETITDMLVESIPGLVESSGPVFELTQIGTDDNQDARQLRESSTMLFDFQNKLRTAKSKAAHGDKAPLRELSATGHLHQLPKYAITDLVRAVRDCLNWGELTDLLTRLPKSTNDDPFFLEQQAVAMGKQGKLHEAIGLLENIIEEYGETPMRLGTLGGRHRELARDHPNKSLQHRHEGRSIQAYRRGMELDLNEYYCSHKLLVTLMERGREQDMVEARKCAELVRAAAERASALNIGNEWLDTTLTIYAFYEQDLSRARELIDKILDQGRASWKLVGLSLDLQSALSWIDKDDREPFTEIYNDMHEALPITQQDLLSNVLPVLKSDGQHYRKFKQVHARSAIEGEVIVSRTGDGEEETSNAAGADDMVVRNLTTAQEQYIVSKTKFDKLYKENESIDDRWTLYDPQGEVQAIEVSVDIMELLDVGEEFFIMASWGSEQFARTGDKLVSPLPKCDEIYRIAKFEFDETYQLKDEQ